MRVARLGLTPVKGMRHLPLPAVELTDDGPRYDRDLCLVERRTGRVLRTVGNDRLLACTAELRPPRLTVRTPLGSAAATVLDGTPVCADYWDREAKAVTVPGPWDALLGTFLGRDVVMCRVTEPGAVVWGGPVSLVTTSSLAELTRRLDRPYDDGARFRATVVVDTGTAPPFVEDGWAGSRLRLGGTAAITVRGPMARCAVVDRVPAAGGQDARVLAALAPDRLRAGEVRFGVDADVHAPGIVRTGDEVRLLD